MKKGIFLCLLLVLIGGCSMSLQKNKRLVPPFYKLDDAVLAVKNFETYKDHRYTTDKGQPLHFVAVGNKNTPAILFIHGSPGNWEGWAEYLHDPELREKTFMVAVDRPGYGGSDNKISGTSLAEQSKAIMSAMQEHYPHQKQWIIVGHSYGGPVALRIAVDYPNNVTSAFLLAPAISPDLVRVRFYNRIADLPIIRSIISTPLHRSNEEMFLLSDELKVMKPKLNNIKKSVTVIQGAKDGIVHPENATFAKEELINAQVKIDILPKQGHFLPWEQFEFIKNKLLNAL